MGTKEIVLTQKKVTLVDETDFDWLSGYKWCFHKGAAVSNRKGVYTLMHRLIMNPPVDLVIDHINRDPLDNRRANLRVCSQNENRMNSGLRKNKKYKGIYFKKRRLKWVAQIAGTKDGHVYLGQYDTPEEAAAAYDAAALNYFGDFASVNFGGRVPLSV